MSIIKISKCEFCGAEQRSDEETYWATKIAKILWAIPIDGINGGKFEGEACVACRRKLNSVLTEAIKKCGLKDGEK